MVFAVPLDDAQKRLHNITMKWAPTNTVATQQTGPSETLPPGVLTYLSTASTHLGTATVFPKKGQCFLQVNIQKTPADSAKIMALMAGYLYSGNDLAWQGELVIEDGDKIFMQTTNTAAANFRIDLTGQLIRTGTTK